VGWLILCGHSHAVYYEFSERKLCVLIERQIKILNSIDLWVYLNIKLVKNSEYVKFLNLCLDL
jgi:hypothetical protein